MDGLNPELEQSEGVVERRRTNGLRPAIDK